MPLVEGPEKLAELQPGAVDESVAGVRFHRLPRDGQSLTWRATASGAAAAVAARLAWRRLLGDSQDLN